MTGPQLVANGPWYQIDGINKNHGIASQYYMYESYIKDRDSPLWKVVSYFVIELYSSGGCPLEEASEHCFLNNKILAVISHCSMLWVYFFAYLVFWYRLAG